VLGQAEANFETRCWFLLSFLGLHLYRCSPAYCVLRFLAIYTM